MKKTLWKAYVALTVVTLAVACAPGEEEKLESPSPTLPAPRVWITNMPATPSGTPGITPVIESTPTVLAAEPIQPWPTADDEQFLLGQIDGLFDKIDRILRDTDTNIKP